MKKIFAFAAAAVTALSVSAEVINFNTAKDWAKSSRMKFIDGGIMEFTGGRLDISSRTFPIDPAKKYVFSAEVRTKPGTPAGNCYIGNWSIMGKRRLLPEFVLAVSKSDSKLLEAAKAGDTRVVIARPACCTADKFQRFWSLTFKAKADLSDLPNTNVSPVAKAEFEGDKVILTLRRKLPRSYAANTPVRFQRSSTGMYGGLSNKKPAEEWTTITWTVAGRAPVATNPYSKWWQGADKGAVRIIANYKHTKGSVLQVRNAKVTISE